MSGFPVDLHSLIPTPTRGPLAGLGLLVTRPARQAAAFAQKLAALGALPIIYPAIVILPPADRSRLDAAHATLQHYDFAFFVSTNAVEYGAPPSGRWPVGLVAFAPGPGTAEALASVGIVNVRVPSTTFDSEGVLALPDLADVRDQRGIVFRGEGGRDRLGATLRSRGAHVDQVACYRRARPTGGADGLIEAFDAGRVHAVTITSSEGLDNLLAVLGSNGRTLLQHVPMFASHPRIAEHARALGMRAVDTAGGDAGLIAGLLTWAGGAGGQKAPSP